MTYIISLMGGDHVSSIKVINTDFKDWDKMLNEMYRPLTSNIKFNNHVFTYDSVSANVLKTQRVGYSSPEQ